MPATPQAHDDEGILALRYEETVPAKPPIPVTIAPPCAPQPDPNPTLPRPTTSDGEMDESKRDSGLAPTTSATTREGSVKTTHESTLGVAINFDTSPEKPAQNQIQSTPSTPLITKTQSWGSGGSGHWKQPLSRHGSRPKTPTSAPATTLEFSPISTHIPTDSLLEAEFLNQMSFSKRGSIMFGGKKAVNSQIRPLGGRRQPSFSMLDSSTSKVLSEELEKESHKVRSMYETGSFPDWHDGNEVENNSNLPNLQETRSLEERSTFLRPLTDNTCQSESRLSSGETLVRKVHELAGGIEDWEDVDCGDVDRYGFINLRPKTSPEGETSPELRPVQRVSTALQLASDTPRKRRGLGRSPSSVNSTRIGFRKTPSRKTTTRSLNTDMSSVSRRSNHSHLKAAANRLPGNRDKRWMAEAGDMLTLPPGLADIAEDEEGGRAALIMKKKEWQRTEKWRKMAKIVKTGKDGEGMRFEFDTKNPKLVERTWKGIPDRWRAAAWYSFLSTSAAKKKDSEPDEDIIRAFYRLQYQSSADDVQIDLDVPRTINSHIMFRRRYRGGQRLLFRVLHALSLYFPDTGYVQGMASLAATLLCYFDEERTFIMLVRMWQLRGLDKLYEAGFPGLMAALDEFQKSWLKGNDVAQKLEEFGIEATAYGTRWYLTLFNYSIPFAAQLRVWDVFMLLGDSDPTVPETTERPFSGGLDVLHAVSAALIDGTREILLDSDFENAMKVLTSWVPVKDEELLMKVTKAEWKLHRHKK